MPSATLEEKLERLPTAPGVYLMKDARGEVIYVGKAVSLRSRVRSYFGRSSDTRAFIPFLESLARRRGHGRGEQREGGAPPRERAHQAVPASVQRPPEGRQELHLPAAGPAREWPRLEVVRRFKRDGAMYFGPYASASSIRETLRIINRYFQLRTCSDHVLHHRQRPCLLYQIGRCPAPCVYDVSRWSTPNRARGGAVPGREGRRADRRAPDADEGRGAGAPVRAGRAAPRPAHRHRAHRWSGRRSRPPRPIDQDVFGHHREADRLVVYVLYVRQGRLTGGQSFPFTGQEFPDEELLGSFVNLYYGEDNVLPDEVLLAAPARGWAGAARGAADREARPAGPGSRAAAWGEAAPRGDERGRTPGKRSSTSGGAGTSWRRCWSAFRRVST